MFSCIQGYEFLSYEKNAVLDGPAFRKWLSLHSHPFRLQELGSPGKSFLIFDLHYACFILLL